MDSREKVDTAGDFIEQEDSVKTDDFADFIHGKIDNLIAIVEWWKTDLLKKGDHKRASWVDSVSNQLFSLSKRLDSVNINDIKSGGFKGNEINNRLEDISEIIDKTIQGRILPDEDLIKRMKRMIKEIYDVF